jgi:hypothetical protein
LLGQAVAAATVSATAQPAVPLSEQSDAELQRQVENYCAQRQEVERQMEVLWQALHQLEAAAQPVRDELRKRGLPDGWDRGPVLAAKVAWLDTLIGDLPPKEQEALRKARGREAAAPPAAAPTTPAAATGAAQPTTTAVPLAQQPTPQIQRWLRGAKQKQLEHRNALMALEQRIDAYMTELPQRQEQYPRRNLLRNDPAWCGRWVSWVSLDLLRLGRDYQRQVADFLGWTNIDPLSVDLMRDISVDLSHYSSGVVTKKPGPEDEVC